MYLYKYLFKYTLRPHCLQAVYLHMLKDILIPLHAVEAQKNKRQEKMN